MLFTSRSLFRTQRTVFLNTSPATYSGTGNVAVGPSELVLTLGSGGTVCASFGLSAVATRQSTRGANFGGNEGAVVGVLSFYCICKDVGQLLQDDPGK